MNFEAVPRDTTPEADRVQMEIYRRMAPSKRLELALEMSDFVRGVVTAGVRSRHPGYDQEQVRMEVIRLTLGDELFRKAYPRVKAEV